MISRRTVVSWSNRNGKERAKKWGGRFIKKWGTWNRWACLPLHPSYQQLEDVMIGANLPLAPPPFSHLPDARVAFIFGLLIYSPLFYYERHKCAPFAWGWKKGIHTSGFKRWYSAPWGQKSTKGTGELLKGGVRIEIHTAVLLPVS